MTAFSADWLRLREPFDHAARATAAAAVDLTAGVRRWRERSPGQALAVVDLACGLGANLRVLAPRLGGVQHWRLVDHDPALLAALPLTMEHWAHRHDFRFRPAGEARSFEVSGPGFRADGHCHRLELSRCLATLDFGTTTLVTASALLDLVSASWLRQLIQRAGAARAAMWFSLNVDGRTSWDPVDPGDAQIDRLFSQHQRRDKGFGPALGPQAVADALQLMASVGYSALQARSDWVVDAAHPAKMQRAMIEGMAAAALEQDPSARDETLSWKDRRCAVIGASRLRVGHVDIVATPV